MSMSNTTKQVKEIRRKTRRKFCYSGLGLMAAAIVPASEANTEVNTGANIQAKGETWNPHAISASLGLAVMIRVLSD